MSIMDDIRKMRETGLMTNGQPLPAPTQGAYVPRQFGGHSDEGVWTEPVWDPTAGGPVQTPAATPAPTPPQLAQPAPSAADFANRQSPELARLQAMLAQRQMLQMPQLPQQAQAQLPPQAMRGMMQNGMFAGASGGLPRAATQNPQMNPVQLMQLLSQFGLMGRGTGGGVI